MTAGCNLHSSLRFEVLTVVRMMMMMMMMIFWVVTQCRLVDRNQCFGETYCLQLQG
jgi:hypothetical protein